MQINRSYSFNSLAFVIASLEFGDHEDININREQFYFKDANVIVDGFIRGYFDYQKGTLSYPEYKDLTDIDISIISVVVQSVDYEYIFTWEEKDKLCKTVKELLGIT